MQGTQRDADLAAWWGWVPKVLGTVFPSGGAGGKSLQDEVWCCVLTARPGSVGSLRPAALQRGSCDSRPGPETPPSPRPRVRRSGAASLPCPQPCEAWGMGRPGSPGTQRVCGSNGPQGKRAVQPEVARAQGGEPRWSQSRPHFRPPALGGPGTPAWWRGQNCRSGGPPAFHYSDGGPGGAPRLLSTPCGAQHPARGERSRSQKARPRR